MKKNKKKIAVAAMMSACMVMSLGSFAGAEEVYEIKLTTTDAPTTIWCEEYSAMAERVKEKTDGKVDIQVYTSGEMLVYDEGIEAVVSDAAVIYSTDPCAWVNYVPALSTVMAPYLWENYEQIDAFEETDLWADILADAAEQNIHMVSPMYLTGMRHILSDRVITTAADCEGLSLRVPGSQLYTDTFEALKTNYQALAFSEVYNALETGMITGLETNLINAIGNRPDESMKGDKYLSLNGHLANIISLWCGEGFWNSLPEEYQTIITEEAAVAAANIDVRVYEAEQEALETIKGYGVEIVEVPDKSTFQEAVAEMNAEMDRWDEISAVAAEIKAEMQ